MTSGDDTSVSARIDEITALLEGASDRDYIGEGVSQLEHALQTAALARRAGAPREEILAALLHDIGHRSNPDAAADAVGVLGHDDIGATYLESLGFDEEVTGLVRGHVAAKRYLVATRPMYAQRLSTASVASLERQGGPMAPDECRHFREDPRWEARVRLRSWDDAAKVRGLEVLRLAAYRSDLEAHLTRGWSRTHARR